MRMENGEWSKVNGGAEKGRLKTKGGSQSALFSQARRYWM